jgi:LuxR family maltose regulon positive regulatory protein
MSKEIELLPLIRTKLHRPRVTENLVARPRLLEYLTDRRQRPLTVVAAPAGYGKTTLVSNWLEESDWPCAWLSLDENDDDMVMFLSYVIAAIQTIFPKAGQKTQALLEAPTLPPQSMLARSLINELDDIDTPFVLVLDDYHVIHQTAIHELVTELLRHPPPSLHLVITTRRAPPLSLRNLRARSQMSEIRIDDLSFTSLETAALLQTMLGRPVSDTTAASLTEKTEGWITGLRLAILSLRHRDDLDTLLSRLPDHPHYVTEYLVGEVLSNLPPSIRQYVLLTAILDRFCAPLCETIFGLEHGAGEADVGGQYFIEWVVKSNLFTVSLDGQGKWYRYHHLFQQLLQHQLELKLDKEEIAALHQRASRWYSENGFIDEALRHALAAGDITAAAELVEEHRPLLLNEDKWYVLERWLAWLPDSTIQQRPKLLIARAWVMFYHFELRAIPPILEDAEKCLAQLGDDASTQALQGEIDFFWGHHWFWQGQNTRSFELFNRALAWIPNSSFGVRGHGFLFWGLASQMSDRKQEAVRAFNEWLYSEQRSHPLRRIRPLGSLAFIHLLSGELAEAVQVTQQMQGIAENYANTYIRAWAFYVMGQICFYRNDLENAVHNFGRVVELRYNLHTRAAIDSLAGLTLAYHALGQPDRSRATMALLLEFAQQKNDPAYPAIARSCQARLALLQGDVASAVRWLQTADLTTDADVMFYWLEISGITHCRVLIAQGSKAGLQQAEELLQAYRQQNENQRNTRQLIDILPLQALVYHKQELFDEALATLEQAVILAQPGGFIRPFVEPGPELADLLNRLHSQGVAQDYIAQILAAFPIDLRLGEEKIVNRKPVLSEAEVSETQNLIEPLTNRELDVLSLLAQGLSNKEIAVQLVITPGTVAQHTHNIYQKLMVRNRRQAVIKATELGIFP